MKTKDEIVRQIKMHLKSIDKLCNEMDELTQVDETRTPSPKEQQSKVSGINDLVIPPFLPRRNVIISN